MSDKTELDKLRLRVLELEYEVRSLQLKLSFYEHRNSLEDVVSNVIKTAEQNWLHGRIK